MEVLRRSGQTHDARVRARNGRAFSAELLAIATLLTFVVPTAPTSGKITGAVGFILLTLLFTAAELFPLQVHYGEGGYTISASEIITIVCFFHSTPRIAIAAHLMGLGIRFLVRRPPRWKFFNVGNIALADLLGWSVFALIRQHFPTVRIEDFASWFAVIASTITVSWSSLVFVFAVSYFAEREFSIRDFGRNLAFDALAIVAASSIGIVAATLLFWSSRTTMLLLIPIAGLSLASRNYLSERRRSEEITFIQGSSEAFRNDVGNVTNEASQLVSILEAARTRFGVRLVEFEYLTDGRLIQVKVEQNVEPLALELTAASLLSVAPVRACVVDPTHTAALHNLLATRGLGASVAAPVVVNSEIEGVLIVADPISNSDRIANRVQSVELLAGTLSVALGKEKLEQSVAQLRGLEEQLTKQLRLDALTGLLNQPGFQEHLNSRKVHDTYPFSLVFVDLNDFKAVNDTFGHASGNILLRVVGERLSSVLDSEDVAARLGGDEFGLILRHPPQLTLDEIESWALSRADHVVRAIEVPVELSKGNLVIPRASIGVATVRPGESTDAALERADAAMYRAKRARKRQARQDAYTPDSALALHT